MKNLAELLFPPKCSACGELLPFDGFFNTTPEGKAALCPECLPLWMQEKEEKCGICNETVVNCRCTTKLMQSAGCKSFCKLGYYRPNQREEVGNRIVYRIKDHTDRSTVRFLAEELAVGVRKAMEQEDWKEKAFFLSYLPRRSGAILKSGNDQAKELAAALADRLELPLVPLIGRRRKSQTPQKFLSPTQRLSNATGAFYLKKNEKYRKAAAGKIAVLVDDIVTSGASMTAGIRLLRRAGAKGFLAVAVASDECNRNPVVVAPDFRAESNFSPYR